jgi:hypothetical protein
MYNTSFKNNLPDESSTAIMPFGRSDDSLIPGYNKEFVARLNQNFDQTFLSKMIDFYNTLGTKEKIRLSDIDNIVEFFQKFMESSKKRYLMSLVFPETGYGVRIPTKFPLPTATFKQKTFFTVTPNSSGNFYLQFTPQSLLETGKSYTANTGELLLNNSAGLNGTTADTNTANYTPLTVARIAGVANTVGPPVVINNLLVNAYRLVSASLVLTYQGSIEQHSGTLGSGLDVSFYDSLNPDTEASVFSVIDDKMWSYRGEPGNGLRIVYFPKDYSDLNFLRPSISTQTQGLSTCVRFLIYGHNLPSGASIKVDLYRNFEYIPTPGWTDYVNMEASQSRELPMGGQDVAIDIASSVPSNNMAITAATDKKKLEDYLENQFPVIPFSPDTSQPFERPKPSSPIGWVGDVAKSMGKAIAGTLINNVTSRIPVLGPLIAGMANRIGDKLF